MNRFWEWMEEKGYAKMMVDPATDQDTEWGLVDNFGEPSEFYTKQMLLGYMIEYAISQFGYVSTALPKITKDYTIDDLYKHLVAAIERN